MKPTTLLWAATFVAACANVATPDAANGPRADRLAEARQLLATRPDAAADLVDAVLRANPDDREARLLAAECSLRMAQNPAFGQTQFHLLDAARNFEKGIDGAEDADVARGLRLLGETRHALGEYEAGSEVALRAAAAFATQKGLDKQDEFVTARLVAARCDYRRFAELRQQELQDGTPDARGLVEPGRTTAQLAVRAAAGFEEVRRAHPGEASMQLAAMHRWLGQTHEAMLEYERGIAAAPDDTALNDAYLAWMSENGQQDAMVGAYARLLRGQADAPMLRWQLGRAQYAKADRLRNEGNFLGAIDAYEKCRATFGDYLARMPQHAESTLQWQALCDLAMARCAIEAGDLAGAERMLFVAADTSPATTTYVDGQPQLVDSFGNHYAGAVFALGGALAQSSDDALARTMAFNAAVLERTPDRWGFVYNNAALAARDLGVQKANDGDEATAKQLWEKSYAWYEKAVELSPEDARIVNDCGLMLIYHLDRDFDRARTLFERAIELGTRQLAAMPEDTDEGERHRLEEAVGDAWQNIAILLRDKQHQPFADYKQFCEQSVRYYPYQRREAAQLLRNGGEMALQSTARAQNGLTDAAAQQGGAAEQLAKAKPAIDRKIAEQDFDGALTLLDELAKSCKEHAPYQLLKGKVTLDLAKQAAANGRKGAEFFFQDAVAALKKAVELDAEPIEPRQLLAQAQFDNGDVEGAADSLSSLLLHMQSQGGGKADDLQAAHALRAQAAARAYAAKKQGGDDDKDLLTAARTSLRFLEQKGSIDAPTLQLWSNTELWAGAPAEAVNVYARAVARAPNDFAMLEGLVNTAQAQNQLPLAVESLAARDDAATVWYSGKARFLYACQQRQDGKLADASKTLDLARKDFEASMAKNAGYKDSCEQYLAMCLGKQGNIAFAEGDMAKAEQLLMEAARSRPDRINEDLGLLETTKGGILRLVDKFYRDQNLKKVEAISRAAAEVANSDVDLLNNAGLFARDYGNQIERNDPAAAKEMYEQSYKAYSRAVQLDPSNVRLRNDVALIAIYHLDRDWELSKQLLESAIADGAAKLVDAPPADENEKQNLEEAVGDCYENLALWHLKHSKDGAAAKAAALKSQDYYPGKRRGGARRHLEAAERLLQGK